MPASLPIGSTITVRGLDGAYIVRSEPYAMSPYSGIGLTLEASDGLRFWWSLSDCIPLHLSYT